MFDVVQILNSLVYDILCFNETKLDETIPNSFLYHTNYISIRHDRNRNGGGTIVFIKRNLSISNIKISSVICDIEFVSFTIKSLTMSIHFICAYKPPIYNDLLFIDNLDNLLHLFNLNDPIFIIGDLNMNLSNNELNNTNFSDFLFTSQLVNYITEPTRTVTKYYENSNSFHTSDSLIDVIIHNSDLFLSTKVTECPFSDHKFVSAKIAFDTHDNSLSVASLTSRCITTTKLDTITNATNKLNYAFINSISDVDNRWTALKHSITGILNQTAPFKPIKIQQNNATPWSTTNFDNSKHLVTKRTRNSSVQQDRFQAFKKSPTRSSTVHPVQNIIDTTSKAKDDQLLQKQENQRLQLKQEILGVLFNAYPYSI